MEPSPRPSIEKLIFQEDSELDFYATKAAESERRVARSSRRLWIFLISLLLVSFSINIILVFVYFKATSGDADGITRWDEFTLPSTAQSAIAHKLVKFENGLNSQQTIFQGRPTEFNNQLWADLYAHEMSRISYEEALFLPNKTSPEAPYEGSGYLIVLNVFHNLHCLDSIRKALYYFVDPKWTAEHNPYVHMGSEGIDSVLRTFGGEDVGINHTDHCIDALRQHQMCSVDITPNVFQYSPKDFGIRAMANVVHECRDFSKIKDWARAHRAPPFKGFGDGEAVGKCGLNDPGTACLYA